MYQSILIIVLSILSGSTTGITTDPPSGKKAEKPDPAKWKLVWSEEFDRPGLPDPAKWDYEEGFVRNEELQYYTRARKENVRVEKGLLLIEGRKETFPNKAHQAGAKSWRRARPRAEYTSGCVITKGKADFKYGRIEVRARIPEGKGVWPAIWMLGTNITKIGWPRCGEIDIMEFVGKWPEKIHGTVHFADVKSKKHRSSGNHTKTKAPFDEFHRYAIEWNEARIDFFFDEIKYHTFELDPAGKGAENPFRKPHYLLINLALGGSWGGEMNDAVLPAIFAVDYVRIYEARDGNYDDRKKPSGAGDSPNSGHTPRNDAVIKGEE